MKRLFCLPSDAPCKAIFEHHAKLVDRFRDAGRASQTDAYDARRLRNLNVMWMPRRNCPLAQGPQEGRARVNPARPKG